MGQDANIPSQTGTSFWAAARLQARVVGSLVLRETRVRYGRSKLGYTWALAEPIFFVTALSAIFYAGGVRPPHGDNMGVFFATGILPFITFRNIASQMGSSLEANEALLHFPIVKELDTLYARAILETSTSLLVVFIMLSVLIAFFGAPYPNDVVHMAQAYFAMAALGFGVGAINAVVSMKMINTDNIMNTTNKRPQVYWWCS